MKVYERSHPETHDARAIDIKTANKAPTLDERVGPLPILLLAVLLLLLFGIGTGWMIR